jgi:transposase
VQSTAPSRPIAKGLAGPGLLAHVLVSKYCDHLPLNRQSQPLDVADWVGECSALLEPLVNALAPSSQRLKPPENPGRFIFCRRRDGKILHA